MKITTVWALLVLAGALAVMVPSGTSCDKPLTVWLSLYTGFLCLSVVIERLAAHYSQSAAPTQATWICVFNSLSFLASVFELAWMIVGSVWVFNPNMDDCDVDLWGFSLAMVVSWYLKLIFFAFICVLYCFAKPVLLDLLLFAGPTVLNTPASDSEISRVAEIIQTEPDQNCPICLKKLELASKVNHMPCSVKHVFHSRCLQAWLRVDGKCPVCKKALAKKEI